MHLPQLIFRITFVFLALIYLLVISEFINPQIFDVNIDVRLDAVALTMVVVAFLYFLFRRTQ